MSAQNSNVIDFQHISPSPGAGYSPANIPQHSAEIPALSYKEAVKLIEAEQDENFMKMIYWQELQEKLRVAIFGLPLLPAAYFVFDNLTLSAALLILLELIGLVGYIQLKNAIGTKVANCINNIKENIYVYHTHEEDRTVRQRKLAYEKMIMKSSNKWYPMVVAIYFRDGQHSGEYWNETWPTRLLQTFRDDRDKRHKYLAREYPEDYLTYIMKQV